MSFLTLNNGNGIYYELHGDAERTVMMIHGLGGGGMFWEPHIEPLVSAGWRVLIADWPGNCRSGDTVTEFSLEMLAGAFEELAERTGVLGRPVVICGHSAGGVLAQMIYHHAPEKIAGLVLLQTSARFMDKRLLPVVNTVMPTYLSVAFSPAAMGAAAVAIEAARFCGGLVFGKTHPAIILADIGVYATRNKNIAAETAAFANVDLDDRLGDIRVPTLVVGSRVDQVVPLSRVRALHAGIPGAELQIIERFGHNAALFHAGETSAMMLDFLRHRFPE